MFKSLRNSFNNFIVLVSRKFSSANKTFYELEKLAYKDSAEFIYANMKNAVLFTEVEKFWDYSLDRSPENGLAMEFGVFSGLSINYFSSFMKKKGDSRQIYGFDSFEGLSEAWGGTGMAKGYFDVGGILPKVNDNVILIKGWIDDTLPSFIEKHNNTKVAFIHVDVDTYAPTKAIFESTQKSFQEGTIIVFDELLGYPGWKEHEHKALIEIVDPHWEYEYIAFCEVRRKDYTSEYIRSTIRITKSKNI